MKKIFIIFFLIMFTCIKSVVAETYYSDYYKVENIDGLDEDEIKEESYNLYNTYKIEYEDIGYVDDNSDYIKDENDYIFKEIITDEHFGDTYVTVYLNSISRFRYGIQFGTINTNTKFYEVEIFNKEEKIKYNTNDFYDISNMYDNNYDTYYQHKDILKSVRFSFLKECDLENIKFVFHTRESIYNTHFILYTEPRIKIELKNNIDRKHVLSFKIDNENVGRVDYLYKDKVKLYKHYKENKIILNEYVKDGENIILDDYKIINEYYKRDKLILKNDLIIDNKDIKIDDFIDYSNGNVKTECNIDYNKNGIYKCNFLMNNLNIEKNVIVDIPDEDSSNNNEEVDIDSNYNEEKSTINDNDFISDKHIIKDSNIKEVYVNDKEIIVLDNNIVEKNKQSSIKKENKSIEIENKVIEKNLKDNNIKNLKMISNINNIEEKKERNCFYVKFSMIIIFGILSIIKIIRIYCRKYLKK